MSGVFEQARAGTSRFTLSATSISDWKLCRRRWELIHVEGWEPYWLNDALISGVLFHEWFAEKKRGREPDTSFHPLLMRSSRAGITRAKAIAGLRITELTEGAQGEVIGLEVPFDAVVGEICWTGRIDMLLKDENGIYVVDLKLTSNPKFAWYQSISDQLLIYAYFLRHAGIDVIGGIWDIIVLPRLTLRKGENMKDFEDRLVQEALTHGPRVQLPRIFTEEEFRAIDEEIKELSREITYGLIYRNPAACASLGCVYMPICQDSSHADDLGFVSRKEERFIVEEEEA